MSVRHRPRTFSPELYLPDICVPTRAEWDPQPPPPAPARPVQIPVDTPPDWRDRANCRDMDTDVFFPAKTDTEGLAAARAVCAACAVTADCLAYALADSGLQGVWAGTSEKQRIELRRRRRVA